MHLRNGGEAACQTFGPLANKDTGDDETRAPVRPVLDWQKDGLDLRDCSQPRA